jgi:hypothetical protein
VKDVKLHDFDLNTEKRTAYRSLVVNPEEKIPLKNLDLDGKIILKWISQK